MDRTATHEDVKLLLHLYELRREPRMREARDWFVRHFRATTPEELLALYPPGSDTNASFRMVTSYWEMAASFVAHGVLHRELFFENCQEMLLVWEKLRELVPGLRVFNKNPMAFKNLEQVAGAFIAWWNERAPEFYAGFAARVRQGLVPPPPPKEG